MNKEDFVSLEVAKLLKEKGFDVKSDFRYIEAVTMRNVKAKKHWTHYEYYRCPTLYEAQKWLRDRCITVIALPFIKGNSKKWYHVKVKDTLSDLSLILVDRKSNYYNTYEEALNAGILEALKMI